MACQICKGSGEYQLGHHENGCFIVESYRCPCRGESRLVERNIFDQPSGEGVLVSFVALTLFAILML